MRQDASFSLNDSTSYRLDDITGASDAGSSRLEFQQFGSQPRKRSIFPIADWGPHEVLRHESFTFAKQKAPSFLGAFLINWATSYSPTHLARAVPSGLKGLTSVFGMGTGGTPSLQSPKSDVEIRSL